MEELYDEDYVTCYMTMHVARQSSLMGGGIGSCVKAWRFDNQQTLSGLDVKSGQGRQRFGDIMEPW